MRISAAGKAVRFGAAVTGLAGSNAVRFGYDADLLLTCASPTSCSPPSSDALRVFRSAVNNQIESITLGATAEARTYNGYGELGTQASTFSGSPLVTLTYDTPIFPRDTLGRIVQKVEQLPGLTTTYGYTYDALHRLTDVTENGSLIEHIDYDANGNRISHVTPAAGTINATYDDQDRLLTYGNLVYTYTANGELESKTDTLTDATTLYQYDPLGNLVMVSLPDGTLIEYLVDGLGRRVGKKVDGVLTQQWLYRDALKPAAELDGDGNLVIQFVYGSSELVPDYVVRDGASYRIFLGPSRLAEARRQREHRRGRPADATRRLGQPPRGYQSGLCAVRVCGGAPRYGYRARTIRREGLRSERGEVDKEGSDSIRGDSDQSVRVLSRRPRESH